MKDFLGACLSGLCLLHCLLVPLLLTMSGAGVMGAWLGSDWVHYVLIAPISLLLVWSLPFAWRQHRNRYPLVMGGIGFSLLLLSLWLPESAEPFLAVIGSLALIFAHLLNGHLLKNHHAGTVLLTKK
jgi:hypothetical protein